MKFIVITLLFLISFSGCIGDNDASGNKTATTVSPPSDGKPVEPVEPSDSTNVITSDIPNPPDTTVPSNITTPTTPATTTPTTTVKPENTTTATTPTTTTPSTTTVKPENTTTATTPTTSPTTSSTTQNPAPDTTVTPPTNVTTTVTPPVTTTKAPAPTPIICRRFDGPSFIGGIVLAVGLMAISVVAYKFYKARTDRNYHTL